MLQARLLGKFEICVDDRPVIISSRPAQSLLTYLLVHPETHHRREKLAGIFWPGSTDPNARSNLRHELWRIRKALGSGADDRVFSDDLGVTYQPQPGDRSDVAVLIAAPGDDNSTDGLRKAVSAYGGELLPGFYEDWVVLERERLRAVFERKLEMLLDRLLAEGCWDEVLEWGEQWIALGGAPEPAYRALMMAQAGRGNLAGAIAQYERGAQALEQELGVEPSERTRQVLAQVREATVASLGLESALRASSTPGLPPLQKKLEKPPPLFIGRVAELTDLRKYLDRALAGQLQVVLVRGEAGSGKSALLHEFTRQSLAAHPNLVVGAGICNAFFGQGDPYLPFRDVLDMLAGDVESFCADACISLDQANQLRECFPLAIQALLDRGPDLVNTFLSSSTLMDRLATAEPDAGPWRQHAESVILHRPDAATRSEKTQLFEQYAEVLRSIAAQRPLLILLDDLQWMDSGTGELLFHLVRRLQKTRVVIAGAYRPEEVALGRSGERHPLEPLLNEFQSSLGQVVIDLDRVSNASGRAFVEAYLDSEPNRLGEGFREELHRRTQGQPFFTIQLLRNLQERGDILQDEQGKWVATDHLDWDHLPPQLEGIIGERIGRLDREMQNLLLAASVEGEQFSVAVLARVQGVDETALLQRLSRDLERRHRIIQELGDVDLAGGGSVRFRFVHGLIQQYLYRQLGNAERASLHREIAETLELLHEGDIAGVTVPLARHYREAGIKEKAVTYLLQAGDRARSLYAHQEAVAHYSEALTYLREMGATEQIARTLMKLYLVYQSCFDFAQAQRALEESNAVWRQLAEDNPGRPVSPASSPYRISAIKAPLFDPALCDSMLDLELLKELFCGLVEWSEDETLIPWAAASWDVLDGGRRYVFHLREDVFWTDGEPVTAGDFEYACKRILNPARSYLMANLLYDIRGARDYHQGRVADSRSLGVRAMDPHTLVIELEQPCGYFLYILGDPVSYAVPRHAIEREGDAAWTEADRIVTDGAFRLDASNSSSTGTIRFVRNPLYFGRFKGNVQDVTIRLHANELDAYRAFVAGELDSAEFLLPQSKQAEWKHYREAGLMHTLTLPFVDAIYFMCDRPPFDNQDVRRAFALAVDKQLLAGQLDDKIAATGGYVPPSLPGHSPGLGLPYAPEEARRLLAAAGHAEGRGLPPVRLLIGIAGLEKGDDLIFAYLQEMWKRNLGITVEKSRQDPSAKLFDVGEGFDLFFTGWFADYPDPASFLQTNYLVDQGGWNDPQFQDLIERGRRTLDQSQRMELYRQADRLLIEHVAVVPLFYGHIYELRQPWVHRPVGSTKYSHQWKDVTLGPH